jgi:hypothetical protein
MPPGELPMRPGGRERPPRRGHRQKRAGTWKHAPARRAGGTGCKLAFPNPPNRPGWTHSCSSSKTDSRPRTRPPPSNGPRQPCRTTCICTAPSALTPHRCTWKTLPFRQNYVRRAQDYWEWINSRNRKNCFAGIQTKNENPTVISKSYPTIFLETRSIFSGIGTFQLENFTRRRIDFLMVVVNIYIIVVSTTFGTRTSYSRSSDRKSICSSTTWT